MARTVYKDTGYKLEHLLEEIKDGRIALPDIQRPFVWKAAKCRDLFDSLYRGYPIGTLMFWETGAEVGTRQVGGGESDNVPKLLVVDGQQRLTALYAVVTGRPVLKKSFKESNIKIAFHPGKEIFEVTDAAIKKDPEFLPNITALWGKDYHPTVRTFLDRLGKGRGVKLLQEEEDEIKDRIDRVHDLQKVRFQVVELTAGSSEEEVAEIFVRINSEGVKLNNADFILTLMSVHWEKGRRQLETFCRDAVDAKAPDPSPKNDFLDPLPDQLLRAGIIVAFRRGRLQHVYSILRGKDLQTGDFSAEFRDAQFDELRRAQDDVTDLGNWHEYMECLKQAGFRSKRMITSGNAFIYTYALWLIGKRDFGLDHKTLREVIPRWFFMAHTTGRYTSSHESQIESDLARIGGLALGDGKAFCAELDRIVQSIFTNDYWKISLPNRLDTSASNSPVVYAYWAALNLLEADMLFSDLPVRDFIDNAFTSGHAVERHHLFSKANLAAKGITERRSVNAIANMAFLDWSNNENSSADDPTEYWSAMKAEIEPEQLKRQVDWHALPVGWEQLDYSAFIEHRRDLIAKVVRDGFGRIGIVKETVDSSSTVQDLIDLGESEAIELKSTARWNVHRADSDKRMEHVIAKAVCGFLNAEGGTLLIGVDDEGHVLGLANDLSTFGAKASLDRYELWLRQHLDNSLSIQTVLVVRIEFEEVNGLDVCVVRVAASAKPVFTKAHEGGGVATEFWVRVGNATKQLYGDDMFDYRSEHWG